MPLPIMAGILGAGTARTLLPHLGKVQLFKEIYSKFSQHPFGFGVMYAGGTTIGYHSNPMNWNKGSKYVGKPQYMTRL